MSNRGQRPRIYDSENLCLEGSTPQDGKVLFLFIALARMVTLRMKVMVGFWFGR